MVLSPRPRLFVQVNSAAITPYSSGKWVVGWLNRGESWSDRDVVQVLPEEWDCVYPNDRQPRTCGLHECRTRNGSPHCGRRTSTARDARYYSERKQVRRTVN